MANSLALAASTAILMRKTPASAACAISMSPMLRAGAVVGASRVRHILAHAAAFFRLCACASSRPTPPLFYARLGFQPSDEADATHILVLKN